MDIMTEDEFIKGLEERGFKGIDGIDSMGQCHIKNRHYLLRTDGLLIYSSIPYHSDAEYYPNKEVIVEYWENAYLDEDGVMKNPFTFEKLDAIMLKSYRKRLFCAHYDRNIGKIAKNLMEEIDKKIMDKLIAMKDTI